MIVKLSDLRTVVVILSLSLFWGCTPPSPEARPPKSPPKAPLISDQSPHFLLSWFEGNVAKTASSVDQVPEHARTHVRIQDTRIPPDQRDPNWIFIADLSKKTPTGNYNVKVISRDKYEIRRHPPKPSAPDSPSQGVHSLNREHVVMYATTHCPYCHKARRWLLEQNIPYVEKDIEKDSQAAMDLQRKGKQQGIPTSGVPMFEVNGKLIPGFDPAAIRQALGSATKTSGNKPSPAQQPPRPLVPGPNTQNTQPNTGTSPSPSVTI